MIEQSPGCGRHYCGSGDLDPTPDCIHCWFDQRPDLFDAVFLDQLQTWAHEVATESRARYSAAWLVFGSWIHGKASRARDERTVTELEGGMSDDG